MSRRPLSHPVRPLDHGGDEAEQPLLGHALEQERRQQKLAQAACGGGMVRQIRDVCQGRSTDADHDPLRRHAARKQRIKPGLAFGCGKGLRLPQRAEENDTRRAVIQHLPREARKGSCVEAAVRGQRGDEGNMQDGGLGHKEISGSGGQRTRYLSQAAGVKVTPWPGRSGTRIWPSRSSSPCSIRSSMKG